MPKLTLSVDPAVVRQAKRYASRHGTSVSRLVQTYLSALGEPPALDEEPPVLRTLRGTLKAADVQRYRDHLRSKYK